MLSIVSFIHTLFTCNISSREGAVCYCIISRNNIAQLLPGDALNTAMEMRSDISSYESLHQEKYRDENFGIFIVDLLAPFHFRDGKNKRKILIKLTKF